MVLAFSGSSRITCVRLEVFGNRCMSIAEQMGAVLRNTSISTNIKERLDYSCAVFDAEGGLVANAPHIPVHLGAMAETVAVVRRRFPDPPEDRRDRNRALGMLLRKGYESELALDALAAHARGD